MSAKLIKIQGGSGEEIHYSEKFTGRNKRPICGAAPRTSSFTVVHENREVDCENCLNDH